MVRRSERTERDYPLVVQLSRNGMYLRNFERFVESHIRHYSGYAPCKHSLACTGRPCKQNIVSAGDGYFQSPLCRPLTAHQRHIAVIRSLRALSYETAVGDGLKTPLALQKRNRIGKVFKGVNFRTFDIARLVCI